MILFRLQQIDSQLDQSRARVRDIEATLNGDLRLQEAKNRADDAALEQQKAQQALLVAERAVQDQNVKIEQTEAALYGGKVQNPKELQDLQNEAAALKRHLSVLEDRQLDTMLALEEAESSYQRSLASLEEVRAQVAEQHAGLNGELSDLQKAIERFEIERKAATTAIMPADLTLYEQLRQQRRGVAVAQVADRACSACGSTLTAALIQAACSPSQLVRCPSCGRLLYAG